MVLHDNQIRGGEDGYQCGGGERGDIHTFKFD
jgi:hypothetical protein